jgi:hypothetical protein
LIVEKDKNGELLDRIRSVDGSTKNRIDILRRQKAVKQFEITRGHS